MFLIDTSVWIDFFRGRSNEGVGLFENALSRGLAYGITGVIYQEVLQGASSAADLKKLTAYLSTLRFFHAQNEIETHEKAARIYFTCRQEGITIRSTIDCLIAQIAIENKLTLIHNDKDYVRIATIVKALRLA